MSSIPEQRREQILQWLREDQLLRIDDLAQRLDVSNMTIHRDLDTLVEMGLVEKVHGAVRLPDPYKMTTDTCHMCEMPVTPRLQFVVTTEDAQTIRACCPHCGLLMLNMKTDVTVALLKDFIYGKIINVHQAYFVLGSRVSICCEPSVLAFASETDAKDFQQGFGGEVLDFTSTRHKLSHSHHHHHKS